MPFITTNKYAPINDLGQEVTDIIYNNNSSHDNFHHDSPTIIIDDLVGYTNFKEYNGLYQRDIVK